MKTTRAQTPDEGGEFEGPIIDVEPPGGGRKRRVRRWVALALVLLILFALGRVGSVYMETLWFGSLGYSSVYWTTFKYGWGVFAVFALAPALGLRVTVLLLERGFAVT